MGVCPTRGGVMDVLPRGSVMGVPPGGVSWVCVQPGVCISRPAHPISGHPHQVCMLGIASCSDTTSLL